MAQSDAIFQQAVKDYYNFQYSAAIRGFQESLGGRNDQAVVARYYLTMSFFELGSTNDALDHLFAGSDLAVETFGEESPQAGLIYIGYGKYYHEKERYDTAQMFYQTALELLEEPVFRGEAYANLAYSFDFEGKFDSAIYYYERASTVMESTLGLYHPYTDWVVASIPYVASHAKAFEKQVSSSLKSLDIKGKLWGTDSEDYLTGIRAVGVAYEQINKPEEQREYFELALPLAKKLYGEKSDQYASYLSNLGNAYAALFNMAKGVELNKSAYEVSAKVNGAKAPQTLNYLRNIGNIYFDAGDYTNALTYYLENLTIQQKVEKNQMALIQPYEDVAQCYENLGKIDLAETYYKKAYELKHDGQQSTLPKSYIAFARIADERVSYDESRKMLDMALNANTEFNDADKPTEAFIRNNLGTVYNRIGNQEKAEIELRKSLEIREALFGKESREFAQTLSNFGNIYLSVGQYDLALRNYRRVLEIEKKQYGSNHPQVAGTLQNIANVLTDLDRYTEAFNALGQAESIYKSRDENAKGLVSIYNNTAITLTDLIKFDEAEAYINEHERLVDRIYGPNSEQMADNFNLSGMLQHKRGYTNDAVVQYEKALKIYEAIGMKDQLDQASVLNNLGLTFLDYGEFSKARDYLNESLRIYQKRLPQNHKDILTTQMNLGLVEYNISNYPKAIEIYQNVLQFGKLDTLTSATVYQNMAIAQSISGDHDGAIASTSASLNLRKAKIGSANQLVADLEATLGNIYLELSQLDLAKEHFDNANEIYQHMSISSSTSRLYLSYADLYAELGRYDDAIKYAQKSIDVNVTSDGTVENNVLYFIGQVHKIDNYYRLYLTSSNAQYLEKSSQFVAEANRQILLAESEISNDQDRVEFGVWKSILTNIGIKAALAQYAINQDPALLEEAFYFSERSKANVLINALKESNVKSFAGVDQTLVDRQRELSGNIQHLKQEVFKQTGQLSANNEVLNNLKAQLFAQQRMYEAVTSKLEESPRYKKLTNGFELASLTKVQQTLIGEKEAIIEYAASDSALHTFLITRDHFQVFTKPFEAKFEQLITAYRNAIIFKSDAAFEYVSRQLYQLTLADVEQFLSSSEATIERLWVVPEGPFNYFPFETLSRNDRYIIEDYEVSYIYSMTLADMLSSPSGNQRNNLLSFAPVFSDPNSSTLTKGAQDIFTASRLASTEDQRGFSINGEVITALPGTKYEVDAIDQMVKKKGLISETLVFDEAKEETIKSGILRDYQFIHFATHGFVNEANPEFSGVFMSQNEESGEDCILFASEIYNLNLDADLVTLSACETGLGKFAYGEGIVGLSRAFLYAGAKNLVVSQWKVSDESTARLMVDFYSGIMNGENKSKALRQAKLALIASEEFKQPYYWAPFVLIGK